ncbi:MAG: prepilin-type N-terminal cleavage/methylation domain-containing protein [Actinomycetota bacterium]|nr:prepilin-type N-terminal cleavage/methylation domain-containing protein [Actinomycetota bacterium]
MSRIRHLLSAENGFTLLELAIVVLILAILVGIVVATYQASTRLMSKTVCRANLRLIRGAIETYRSVNDGQNPPALNDLKPSYIKDTFEFKCPATGQAYTEIITGGGVSGVSDVKCLSPGHEGF